MIPTAWPSSVASCPKPLRGQLGRRYIEPWLPSRALGTPDGHFKFPHLWPPKLLQAGRPNYRCLGCGLGLVTSLDGFSHLFWFKSQLLFGKRSASGRRHRPRSGGQATSPAGAVHRPRPVGRWSVHGGRVPRARSGRFLTHELEVVHGAAGHAPRSGGRSDPCCGLLHPVALALKLQQRRAMHQPIQNGRAHRVVAQVFAPVLDHPI